MPRWVTVLLGAIGVIGNYTTLATSLFPAEHREQVSAGLTIGLAFLAYIAHAYNPDGTAAGTPYTPPEPAPQQHPGD